MKKSREQIIEEMIREEKKANPNLKVLPASSFTVKSNKRDSFSENMKSQEQADTFMQCLKWLQRDIEEREQQKEK